MYTWFARALLLAASALTAFLAPRLLPVQERPLEDPYELEHPIPDISHGLRPVRTPGRPQVLTMLPDLLQVEQKAERGPHRADLLIAIDTSGSMRVRHQLDHAVHATRHLLAQLSEEDRVTVLRFAHDQSPLCISCTPAEAAQALREAAPLPARGSSDLFALFRHIESHDASKKMILTDGAQTWTHDILDPYAGRGRLALIAPSAQAVASSSFALPREADIPVFAPDHPRDLALALTEAFQHLSMESAHASR